MSVESEKKFQVINEGRMASLISQEIGNFISDAKQHHLALLLQNFRSGKIDQATLLTSVAGLSALEDLEKGIQRKIVKAQVATKEQKI